MRRACLAAGVILVTAAAARADRLPERADEIVHYRSRLEDSEWEPMWLVMGGLRFSVVAIVALIALLALDIARVRMVREDGRRAVRLYLGSLAFVLRTRGRRSVSGPAPPRSWSWCWASTSSGGGRCRRRPGPASHSWPSGSRESSWPGRDSGSPCSPARLPSSSVCVRSLPCQPRRSRAR